VARSPARPRALQWQVFLGAQAVDHGIVTPYQLRSSAWISPLHGVYADSRLDCDHGLRCRAAALRLPAGVTFAGPSAAWLYGVEFAAGYGDPCTSSHRPDVASRLPAECRSTTLHWDSSK